MPYYHRLGEVPHKRHVVFRNESGHLYHEELMGNLGFTGISSLLYHIEPPTRVKEFGRIEPRPPQPAEDPSIRHRHFRTSGFEPGGDVVHDRQVVLYNEDVVLSVARPTRTAEPFFRNGQFDEMIFVTEGSGVLESQFGKLTYRKGDYLIVPRGVVSRMKLDESVPHRLFIVESRGVLQTPKRYRNAHGQHVEWSPFCERDFRAPEELVTIDQSGEFEIVMKQRHGLHRYTYSRHPFDVVGWDGYYYPWAFNVEDFEPIVGRLHQPPPVHQVFEGPGFVVCNFVPRLYDFHPEAVAVPYNHTNAQSDEVIYYAKEEFMSRKGIEFGSITHHPDGIPHGPHPGTVERGLGAKETDELAVMVDTFRPLQVSRDAESIEDASYWRSWDPDA